MASEDTEPALRPAELEDWFDTLPYADFTGTCARLVEALRATAGQALKPGLRLELMYCYWRPYHYLLNSHVKPGAERPTLRSVNAVQGRIKALAPVCLAMAAGARQGFEEALHRKSLFANRPPGPDGLLLALKLCSHALVLHWHQYAPAPPQAWQQVHDIWQRAEALGMLETAAPDVDDERGGTTTVLAGYAQLAATGLADPHHLPPGSVWEVYDQVRDWVRAVPAHAWPSPGNTAGLFVLDLAADHGPVSSARLDQATASTTHRCIDLGPLTEAAGQLKRQLELGQRTTGLRLHRGTAALLLDHLLRNWTLPPRRYFPRRQGSGTVAAAVGYRAAWYFLNDEQDFAAEPDTAADEADILAALPGSTEPRFQTTGFSIIDAGSGGLALGGSGRPASAIRVGELLLYREAGAGQGPWQLGVIRWLMMGQADDYRLGVQELSRHCEAVIIRATGGGTGDPASHPAFMMVDPAMTQGMALVVPRWLHEPDRSYEVLVGGNTLRIRAGTLRDRTTVFDHFSCRS